MAAGDVKGDNFYAKKMTAGAAITKGQVVHFESDGKWDPVVDTDTGKFGVALEAASGDTVEFNCLLWGMVEVTAIAATIAQGQLVMAGTTGKVALADFVAQDEVLGTAMEAFGSGGTQTIWLGLLS